MSLSILELFPDLIVVAVVPARFVPRTQCWNWTGRKLNGYGCIRYDGKDWKTHRLSYFLAKGQIPKGMMICHTCDNPPCVNPEHLFLGTSQDNQQDRIKWETRISVEELKQIRDSDLPSHVLARRWKLSVNQVEAIRPRRLYFKNSGRVLSHSRIGMAFPHANPRRMVGKL